MRSNSASNKFKALFALVLCGSSVMAALGSACGGSSEVKDAGPDVVADNAMPVDTGVDTGAKDAGCDAPDLLTFMAPDAAIGDGGNQAACYNCIRSACMSVLTMCNMDCSGRTIIAGLPGCLPGELMKNMGDYQKAFLACTLDKGLEIGFLAQLTCAQNCGKPCGYNPPPGDAAADAPDGG